MKLAFVSTFDPHDPHCWSGHGFHMARALESAGCKLQYIGPLRQRNLWYFKGLQLAYRTLLNQELQRDREPVVLDGYAQQIEQQLAGSDAQIVFSVGGVAIAHLKTDLPIVFWADGTYAAIVDSYHWGRPPSKRSRILAAKMEAEGLNRAAMAIYSSEWAAQSAIELCRADPKQVHVVPFGANIPANISQDNVRQIIAARSTDRCRLLYVGTGWTRKGGDIAVEVARKLNESGVPTHLSLVGSDLPPPSELPSSFVSRIGFLDKATAQGQRRFDELMGQAHFLILAARAEAFGVVLCEAASYGVPVLATRVGGIPSIVREGRNGFLFEPENPCAIAASVKQVFADRAQYQKLAQSSFEEYEARLNWQTSGRAVSDLLQTLIA